MAFFFLFLLLFCSSMSITTASPAGCRSSCGGLPIRYPLAVDDGCGSPAYRHLLSCLYPPSSPFPLLLLRTPSGSYPVLSLHYSDPHLVVSDPSTFTCTAPSASTAAPAADALPFTLDASTPFSLSFKNNFLFLNCSPEAVLVQPSPAFCDRSPERCGSACDSAAYFCQNLPGCPEVLADPATTCCSYFPAAPASVRMMLRHCASYAVVHWRVNGGPGASAPYEEVPEYGVRVDFEIPAAARCRRCVESGGGSCGFDTATRGFLCLCDGRNSTTDCEDGSWRKKVIKKPSAGVVAGTVTVASFAGVAGVGALIYYLRKIRSNKVVTSGVESNQNRLF